MAEKFTIVTGGGEYVVERKNHPSTNNGILEVVLRPYGVIEGVEKAEFSMECDLGDIVPVKMLELALDYFEDDNYRDAEAIITPVDGVKWIVGSELREKYGVELFVEESHE